MPPTLKPKPKAKIKASDADTAPDVERGDEIYFRTPQGPATGKVLARGKHGVTLDHKGTRVPCRWDDVHGHKSKVRPNVRVVDQGDDGMIVEDEHGQRRFVRDSLNPEPEMTKALRPVVLLFGRTEMFAKAIANKPGLSLVNVTDKKGHQTKRWKRHGDSVTFKHPVHGQEAKGHIHGTPGKDGAHVKDAATGEVHQVENEHIKDPPANGSPDQAAAPAPAPASETENPLDQMERANNDGAKKAGMEGLFRSDENDKLPAKSQSAYKTWEEIKPKLQEAQTQLTGILSQAAKAVGATQVKRFDDEIDAEGPIWGLGPPKTEESARKKAAKKYNNDFSRLGDAVRGSMGFDTVEQLKDGIEKLQAAGLKLAAKPDNKFISPTSAGYRDMNLNVLMPNGVVGELQLHLKPILKAKRTGHHDYDVSRDLEAKKAVQGLTDGEEAELQRRIDKQRKLYGEAMQEALKAGSDKPKSKAGDAP